MATSSLSVTAAIRAAGLLAVLLWACGCQQSAPVSGRRLIEHQALVDFSGLKPAGRIEAVRTSLAIPRHWDLMPPRMTALYSHEQWRSPSTHTGVGVAYIHTPIPLSPKLVVWLAKQEYSKRASDGKVLDEWTDALGRYWFEAENEKYHIRGYVVAKGFSAWVVYVGYRVTYAPDLAEISLAARSLETAVPLMDDVQPTAIAQSAPTNATAHPGS